MRGPGAVGAALVVVVGVGWGLLAPATKFLFGQNAAFDGPSVAVARAAWVLPFFLVVFAAAWMLERPHVTVRRAAAIAGAGIAFGLGITLVFSIAAAYTSVAHISFLIGTSPVTNTAAAALAFRIPLGRRERLALVLGVIGVGLLAATETGGRSGLIGDGLMVVWLAAFAAYAVLLRYAGTAHSPTLTMSAIGTIGMAAVLLVAPAIPGAFRGVAHVIDTPATAWWFFGEIVLGATIVAQTAFVVAVRRFGVAVATIGAEYTALATGIAASIALHEPWSPLTVVAGLILASALAVTFVRVPARTAHAG